MKRIIIALGVLLTVFIFYCQNCYAETQPELCMMRATAYADTGKQTKSGIWPYEGVAGAREDLIGKTAIVYQRLPGNKIGELIGIYEIEDTGSTEGCINGHVIDIWRPNLDECQLFMNRVYEDGCQGKVFVQFIDAEG